MHEEHVADLRHPNVPALYVDSCVGQGPHSAVNGLDDDYVNHMYRLCFTLSGEIEETLNGLRPGHLVEIDVQTWIPDRQATGMRDALPAADLARAMATQCHEM